MLMRFGNSIVNIASITYQTPYGLNVQSCLRVYDVGDSSNVSVRLEGEDADKAWAYLKALENIQVVLNEVKKE